MSDDWKTYYEENVSHSEEVAKKFELNDARESAMQEILHDHSPTPVPPRNRA